MFPNTSGTNWSPCWEALQRSSGLKGPGSEPPLLCGSDPPLLSGSEPPLLCGSETPLLCGSDPLSSLAVTPLSCPAVAPPCPRCRPWGMPKVAFPPWCFTFAVGRALPYSGFSMYYLLLARYFNYPLGAGFCLFVFYCKVFWTFFKWNTFSNQKHWPYMVRSWMACTTYTVIKERVGGDCRAGKGQEFCLVPFWTADDLRRHFKNTKWDFTFTNRRRQVQNK